MSETEKKAAEALLKDKNVTSKELYLGTRLLQRLYAGSNQYTIQELLDIFSFLSEVHKSVYINQGYTLPRLSEISEKYWIT